MIENRIFVVGGDNYNTAGMIRSLGEAKISFDAIIIKSIHPLASKSKYLKSNNVTMVNSVEEVYKTLIERKESGCSKTFLLVEGDNLTGYLDTKYDSLEKYYIWNNAGEQGKLSRYLNKYEQLQVAKKCGMKVLDSRIVYTGEIPEDLEYPIITKAITSEIAHWKSEVFICNNDDELREAYSHIDSSKVMLQKYIKKQNENTFDGFSINRGKDQFIAIRTKYNYLLPDKYSFFLTAENCDDEEITQQITSFMSSVGYEGIYEFEYIIGEDGERYFMENNFRNGGWSYAATVAGMPLPILWMESMLTGCVDKSKIKRIKKGFTFMNDASDFNTRVLGKMIPLSVWLKDYFHTDCKLVTGRKDYAPVLANVVSRFRNRGKEDNTSY